MKEIIFQRERFSKELVDEIMPITEAHFQEVAQFEDIRPDVNLGEYQILDKTDKLRIYTARNGRLVGYAVFVVHDHPHYGVKAATQTLLYLMPHVRTGMTGMMFLRACDEKLKGDGVKLIYHSSSEKKDITPLLKRIGYEKIEEMWGRRI